MCSRPIAIWGTDIEAVQIYYELEQDGERVECFFDNNVQQDGYFLDKPVFQPIEEKVKKYFIYIGCKYRTYRVIANQLEEYGLGEMEDFLWFNLYKKKIVVLHGNCHMQILRHFLMATKEFVGGGYEIYPNEVIQLNKKRFINENVLKVCDLFIQQDIRDENKYGYKLGTKYLSSKISSKTKNIILPNLFGLGYGFFPLAKRNINNEPLRKDPNRRGMFPRTISIIDDMLLEEMSADEIAEKLNDEFLLSHNQIIDNFNNYIEKIRAREEKCDVKISHFILAQYHQNPIFYDIAHPTNLVMEEMWRQICELIGIKAELNSPVNEVLDTYEDPILPCVKSALELQYDDEIRSNSTFRLSGYMDLEEYIKEYIWWRNKSILRGI